MTDAIFRPSKAPWGSGLLAVILLSIGCYAPDLAPGKYKCMLSSECPPGQVCERGLCVLPGTAVDGGQLPVSPCAGEGTELASGIWACRGNFGLPGQPASRLCGARPDYGLCLSTHEPLFRKIESICADPKIPGFYASFHPIEKVQDDNGRWDISCTPQRVDEPSFGLLGCGTGPGVRRLKDSCFRLTTALRCSDSATWTCFGGPGTASHRDAEKEGGGVLCCQQ